MNHHHPLSNQNIHIFQLFLSCCFFQRHRRTWTHMKCSTSLPSTPSPGNAPSDSVPALSARLFPSPHPPGCSATTRRSGIKGEYLRYGISGMQMNESRPMKVPTRSLLLATQGFFLGESVCAGPASANSAFNYNLT